MRRVLETRAGVVTHHKVGPLARNGSLTAESEISHNLLQVVEGFSFLWSVRQQCEQGVGIITNVLMTGGLGRGTRSGQE